ncbi:MAG: CRISPR-associated endonuclease Cas1 [Nitrospira sp. SB0677_bin_15]|nr:CRISPR-associated endonuclease Cas1 [Nitrospira sp. SB0667_bin_9]MYG40600.1 CRISPR-associated endonuclease Cas1 [Nitrospira sp. SB0677_bin_15]MYH02225.1 CRISPR-associated endonuclease Cas1 [Nitrospira sp. SB0675_bin_23]MYJ23120.1 CRISPR-associated endonuclease Cas1 [Nitrospira sp. SB0673_bin_12]
MSTLYVDRKNIELRLDGGRLRVYEGGHFTTTIPVAMLDQIVIRRHALVDTRVLSALAEHGAGFIVIDPLRDKRTACLAGVGQTMAGRRVSQYARSSDEAWCSGWARTLVRSKVQRQHQFLTRALLQRPDQRHDLCRALDGLKKALATLHDETALSCASIRGIEGSASAAYFRGFRSLFAPSLRFLDRNRRPPRDPVNACLSLAYTLVHAETVKAIRFAGLDPLIGFYHELLFGRESLACDLVEPLRPRMDEWVWSLFRERTLRVESFSEMGEGCLLGKQGRKAFYASYETVAMSLRKQLRRMLRLVVRALEVGPLSERSETA